MAKPIKAPKLAKAPIKDVTVKGRLKVKQKNIDDIIEALESRADLSQKLTNRHNKKEWLDNDWFMLKMKEIAELYEKLS